MKTIHMGVSHEPRFELPEGYEGFSEETQAYWKHKVDVALRLRDTIISTTEDEGGCELNWLHNSELRFLIHAQQWEKAMPEYEFVIGRYWCEVKQRVVETCDICEARIPYSLSLCQKCDEEQSHWDEDLDAHIMKNGDVYKFCSVVGKYELQDARSTTV